MPLEGVLTSAAEESTLDDASAIASRGPSLVRVLTSAAEGLTPKDASTITSGGMTPDDASAITSGGLPLASVLTATAEDS